MRGLAIGTWDLLTLAHVRFLTAARSDCSHLTVAILTDEASPRQPVCSVDERGQVVAALRCVDNVVVCNGDLRATITEADAQLLFHGDDWLATPPVAEGWLDSQGVTLCFIPETPGLSTTDLFHRIDNRVLAVDEVPEGLAEPTLADFPTTVEPAELEPGLRGWLKR